MRKILMSQNKFKKPILLFSLMAFFWTMFDSIVSYVTPVFIEQQGISLSLMGFIIGFSSLVGAIFDFLMYKIFKRNDFRRVLLLMFVVCALMPVILWGARTLWLFLLAMGLWGIYFDLYGFGLFQFVEKYIEKKENTANFSFIQIFRSVAKMIIPLIIGLIAVETLHSGSRTFATLFLVFAFLCFLVLSFFIKKHTGKVIRQDIPSRFSSIKQELALWEKIGHLMLPVLYTTFFVNVIDAFFWTLAPIYSTQIGLSQLGGLFLTAYIIPVFLVGWFVGGLTKKYGKKKTAFVFLFIGSCILSSLIFISNPYIVIAVIFLFSCCVAITYPAISGVYSDNISEAEPVEIEIEGLADFASNIGYIVGPILAGVIADIFTISTAFTVLGVLGVFSAIVLFVVTPKHINVRVKKLGL